MRAALWVLAVLVALIVAAQCVVAAVPHVGW